MSQVNPSMAADLSLVVCTYGRTQELNDFLESISKQTRKPTEIIIVDQNERNTLSDLIKKWQPNLPILHRRVDFKGASRSRNYGAREAKCSLISFPDDDCLYPPSTIEHIIELFEINNNVDTIITAKIEPDQIYSNIYAESKSYSPVISVLDLFKAKAETSNIFTRRTTLETLTYVFDERIGPGTGTPWASNEETDL